MPLWSCLFASEMGRAGNEGRPPYLGDNLGPPVAALSQDETEPDEEKGQSKDCTKVNMEYSQNLLCHAPIDSKDTTRGRESTRVRCSWKDEALHRHEAVQLLQTKCEESHIKRSASTRRQTRGYRQPIHGQEERQGV